MWAVIVRAANRAYVRTSYIYGATAQGAAVMLGSTTGTTIMKRVNFTGNMYVTLVHL